MVDHEGRLRPPFRVSGGVPTIVDGTPLFFGKPIRLPAPPVALGTPVGSGRAVAGGTLSATAGEHRWKGGGCMRVFEADRPSLRGPDRIQPGRVLHSR